MMTKSDFKKLFYPLTVLFALAVILSSCNDQFTNIGVAIRPGQDDIYVFADTFVLDAENWMVPAISAQADTMVLGCYISPVFGTTKADLLIQLAAPEGYSFPDNSYKPVADSLALLLFYNTYFGNPYAPLQISIYELNGDPIDYSTRYYSNLNIAQYCDSSTAHLLGDRTFSAIDLNRTSPLYEDSAETPYIRYKFNDFQTNRFFQLIRQNPSISTAEFLKTFPGMFVTTTYGTSTMVYVNQATLYLYYHYTYRREGHDTVVRTSIAFPANHEVRQLNRFLHPDRDKVVASIPDSLLYMKSAAGIYPKIRIPYDRIRAAIDQRIEKQGKLLNITAAQIDIECIDDDDVDPYMTEPAAIIAIASSSFDNFLKHYTAPTGYETDRVSGVYSYSTNSYSLNFATILNKALQDTTIKSDSVFEFVLVPLNVEYQYNSSGTITSTAARPLVKLAGTRLRSPRNPKSPLRLKILYEGF